MKTVLFGAGQFGSQLLQEAPPGWEVVAFADNDEAKQGTSLGGVPVVAPDAIAALAPQQIVISCLYDRAVREQLRGLGLDHLIEARDVPRLPRHELRPDILGDEILIAMETNTQRNGSPLYDRSIAMQLGVLAGRWLSQKRHPRLLHIGPRWSMGVEIQCAQRLGWSSVSVEPYPEFEPSYRVRTHCATMRRLAAILWDPTLPSDSSEEGEGIDATVGSLPRQCWRVAGQSLELISGSLFEEVDLPGESFDIVYSNAVLEHVEDIPATAKNCFHILRPGGIAVHQIDLRDHMNFCFPLDFLQYDSAEWEAIQTEVIDYKLNRLRYSDYLRIFADAGFERVEARPTDHVKEAYLQRMLPCLRRQLPHMPLEDLRILGAFFAFRKPR